MKFMKIHSRKVEEFSGILNYIESSNMENDKVWATEVEIYFTAAFLNSDIYCFITNTIKKSSSWIRYSHSLEL